MGAKAVTEFSSIIASELLRGLVSAYDIAKVGSSKDVRQFVWFTKSTEFINGKYNVPLAPGGYHKS